MSDSIIEEDAYEAKKIKEQDDKKKHEKDVQRKLYNCLRDAVARRNISMLESSLSEWEERGYEESKQTKRARAVQDAVNKNQDLQQAMKDKDEESIKELLLEIQNEAEIQKDLQLSRLEAESLLEKLENFNEELPEIDADVLSELETQKPPSKRVHRVLQASLLLLGYDEVTSSDWTKCRKLLSPEILPDIQNIDVARLDCRIVATAKYILQDELYDVKYNLPVKEVFSKEGGNYQPDRNYQVDNWVTNALVSEDGSDEASSAAIVFSDWALGIIDQYEDLQKEGDAVPPVVPSQQQKMLGKKFSEFQMKQQSPQGRRKQYPPMNGRYLQKQQSPQSRRKNYPPMDGRYLQKQTQ